MIFDMPSCGGCRTCEMACSFKHRGEFIPAISSLKIMDKGDEPGFNVLLLEESDQRGIACDFCQELEVPLCLQYCRESEDLEKILKEFKEKQGRRKRRRGRQRG
jgi:Fe-S-cluster-containing hydrogenase component 2